MGGYDNVFMNATMATTTVTTTMEMTTIKAMAVTRAGGAPNAYWWEGGRRWIAVAAMQ